MKRLFHAGRPLRRQVSRPVALPEPGPRNPRFMPRVQVGIEKGFSQEPSSHHRGTGARSIKTDR